MVGGGANLLDLVPSWRPVWTLEETTVSTRESRVRPCEKGASEEGFATETDLEIDSETIRGCSGTSCIRT